MFNVETARKMTEWYTIMKKIEKRIDFYIEKFAENGLDFTWFPDLELDYIIRQEKDIPEGKLDMYTWRCYNDQICRNYYKGGYRFIKINEGLDYNDEKYQFIINDLPECVLKRVKEGQTVTGTGITWSLVEENDNEKVNEEK